MEPEEATPFKDSEHENNFIEYQQNRDFIATIEIAMKKCVIFLNDFHQSAQYQLSTINTRLTSLERKLDCLEAQMTHSLADPNNKTLIHSIYNKPKYVKPIPFEKSIFNPSIRNKLNQKRLNQQQRNKRRYNEIYSVGPWPQRKLSNPLEKIQNQVKRFTVYGYIRSYQHEMNMYIPPEIIALIVVWFSYQPPAVPPVPPKPSGPPPVPPSVPRGPPPPPYTSDGPPPVPPPPQFVPTVSPPPPVPVYIMEEMEQLKRQRDELTVYGYIYCNKIRKLNIRIPLEIINLFVSFYYISISQLFPHFDKDKIDLYVMKETEDTTKPNAKSSVEIGYVGYLCNGNNTISNLKQFIKYREVIHLGKKQNIKGLEKAIVKMTCGSTIKLWIPSKLAYGARGAGDLIPSNCDLLFDLTLYRILK